MRRVDGRSTTLLHGTSRRMCSSPPQDPPAWRTCTAKPSSTSNQYWGNVISYGGMAIGVLSTIPKDPPLQPTPVPSVMITKMRMKKQIQSVLSLHQKRKDLLPPGDLRRQRQVTALTFILKPTGPSHFPCQHRKRRCGSKPKQSRLTWFLLT